jgi:hypothetical protein
MAEEPQSLAQKPAENGPNALLAKLATSGDKTVQLGILILVGLSGLGNFLSTQSASRENLSGQQAIQAAVREQINDIHHWQEANYNWVRRSIDEFHKGNEDTAANRKMLQALLDEFGTAIESQTKMLENQTRMLQNQNVTMANDTKILEELARALAPLTVERAYPSPAPTPIPK